jgi:membrane protease YdiL (CAAX protease family)
MSVMTWKLMLPHQRRQPVTIFRMLVSCWTLPLLAVVAVVVLVKNAERSVSGEFAGALLALMATITIVLVNWENLRRYRQDSLVRANRTAITIESAASGSEITTVAATEKLPEDVRGGEI